MRFPLQSPILALGLFSVLASCGGKSELSGAEGEITAAALTTVLANSTFFTDMNASMVLPDGSASQAVNLPISNIPADVGASAISAQGLFDNCTTETGSKTDGADSDAIPKLFRQEFNCSGVPHGTGVLNLTGFFSVMDLDETKHGILGGFAYEYEFNHIDDFPHEKNVLSATGSWRGDVSGNVFSITSKNDVTVSSVPTSGPGGADLVVRTNWVQTYKADDPTLPWAKGELILDGYSGISGYIETNTGIRTELAVAFKVQTDKLMYDRGTCSFFKSGSMTYTDGAGNVIKDTYTNCNMVRTLNGATL